MWYCSALRTIMWVNTIYYGTLQEINQDPEMAKAAATCILAIMPPPKSSLYRKRKERLPDCQQPVTRWSLGGEWAKTGTGEDFLLASQNNIHIFATEGNLQLLQLLAQAEKLYVNGTFQMAPQLFVRANALSTHSSTGSISHWRIAYSL